MRLICSASACLLAIGLLAGCAGTAGDPDDRAAAALESQGKWAEAVPIRQRILAETEKQAGADDQIGRAHV